MMIAFIAQWSHAFAAVLFGALAMWQARREWRSMLVVALGATAFWALSVALLGADTIVADGSEQVRNLAWLGFMYRLWRQADGTRRAVTVGVLYAILVAILLLSFATSLWQMRLSNDLWLEHAAFLTKMILHMTSAVGALVLVHNLYTAATPDTREALRLPLLALAVMWIYDLNLYTISYLSRGWSVELAALRGVVIALTAPIFGLAAFRTRNWAMRLSRTVTFQSLSLVAIGGYLAAMVVVTSLLNMIGGEATRVAQVAFVFSASLAGLMLVPSSKFRAWFKVKISKHFFQHRYDYRAEWLRFTDTLGRPGDDALPLEARVIQSIADIAEAPGGLLLAPDETGGLAVQARWNWHFPAPPEIASAPELAQFLIKSGRVIELASLRTHNAEDSDEARWIPEWIIAETGAWVIVPLVHFNKLAGAVLLVQPPLSRTLDWEDFDLFRVAGRQVASYLAEARAHESLSEARRFDEFNRRFAFIMHDIKNLVSQLSLVTRNAERHADNPAFRADMIATLQNSTARMNDLLARLSQHHKGRAEEPRAIEAGPLLDLVARAKRPQHPVIISGETNARVLADPVRLEQALIHLVQNAIEASPENEPVSLDIRATGDGVMIDVIDRGSGMSAAFVRSKLFQPFTSTKNGGFGIGAYEARTLIGDMGGHLSVKSHEGAGSCFTIQLPAAPMHALLHPDTQDQPA